MRRLIFCILTGVVALGLTVQKGYAQGGGPPGGDVRAIAIDPRNPDTLYAGTIGGGVFKSTNGGATWAWVGLPYGLIWALAVDPSNPRIVYAGGWGGLFKSTDGGASWSIAAKAGAEISESNVSAVVIAPSNPATVYVGTWENGSISAGGIYKSTNGGGSWTRTPIPGGGDVLALAMHPRNPAVLYVLFDNFFVFKSLEGGGSWTQLSWISGTGQATSLALDPSSATTVYVGVSNGGAGVFKSIDEGATWAASNVGLTNRYVSALASDPRNPGTLYAGTNYAGIGGGVFKSTNGGAGWSDAGLPYTRISVLAIDPSDPTTLYAGTEGGGVFKSTNAGASWSAVNNGLTNTDIRALAIDPSSPGVVYAGGWGGVFKSTNEGASWSTVNTGITNRDIRSLAIDPRNPATLYAGSFYGRRGSLTDVPPDVFKSTDGGFRWRTAKTGLPGGFSQRVISALAIDPSNPATLYAAIWDEFPTGEGGVFKSINGGASWSPATNGIEAFNRELMSFAIDPSNTATLYVGTDKGGVYKSTNGGASWARTGLGKRTYWVSVWALAVDPVNPATVYAGAQFYIGAWPNAIYKTTNGGESWTEVSSGLRSDPRGHRITALAIDRRSPTTVYAGALGGGIFKTVNGGESWSAANAGLPYLDIWALAIDPANPTMLYASTWGGGVFKSTDGGGCWQPTGPRASNGPPPAVNDAGVVNNSSFVPGPIAPGSIAAVFGTDLNNGSSIFFSCFGPAGKLVTSLGDANVTVNNLPAPLFYSTPGQLGIQVPFELAGQSSATIQVRVGSQASVSRTISLDSFAPGIFTRSQDGRGAAAVLHEDGVTPVNAQSPARRGEVVVLFATGLGAVNPPLATGAPSTGNRTVTTPTVTIDGTSATVEFSGAAPGYVGLYQVNVRIPPNTRPATDVPLVLNIGGKQSNPVTIAVAQ